MAQNTWPSWPCLPTTSFDFFSKDFLLEAAALCAKYLHIRIDIENDTMLYITYMHSTAKSLEPS